MSAAVSSVVVSASKYFNVLEDENNARVLGENERIALELATHDALIGSSLGEEGPSDLVPKRQPDSMVRVAPEQRDKPVSTPCLETGGLKSSLTAKRLARTRGGDVVVTQETKASGISSSLLQ